MKVIQRNITIIIWCCTLLISIFAMVSGFEKKLIEYITITMFTVSITATILYFVPIAERIKAVLVLLMTGIATLVVSIFLGGNGGTFVASFLVLGMAVLYFDPFIMMVYSVIYLIVCMIAYGVNHAYIVGSAMESYMGGILIAVYMIMAIMLYMTTKFGNKYMQNALKDEKEAQEKSKIIEMQTSAAYDNSISLYEKVESGSHMVNSLFDDAKEANEASKRLKKSETVTIATFMELYGKISNSSQLIEENNQLIFDLKENIEDVRKNVADSKNFSDHAKHSMNDILSAIQHADECIKKSSEETKKIGSIIKDINEIASQTNLLAINASIEAARVSDSGTGFDVVAEQIRTLSVQSKQASENINQILGMLSESLHVTEGKVTKGMEAVQRGDGNLAQMIQCIEDLNRYSKQSQSTLNQEAEVFGVIKEGFSHMVAEVEKSMDSAQRNMAELEVVGESIQSQTNRTEQVSEHLNEMESLADQIRNQFTLSKQV